MSLLHYWREGRSWAGLSFFFSLMRGDLEVENYVRNRDEETKPHMFIYMPATVMITRRNPSKPFMAKKHSVLRIDPMSITIAIPGRGLGIRIHFCKHFHSPSHPPFHRKNAFQKVGLEF